MKTRVVIIGAGPAGLLLSDILHRNGIASIVLEQSSREHVLSRIRAGVLEQTTVDVLPANALAERLNREGHPHDGMKIVWAGRDSFFIDTVKHVGKGFMTCRQTQIEEDLFDAADRRNADIYTGVENVQLDALNSDHPVVTFSHHGETVRIDCEFIAGSDGFHGVSRWPSNMRAYRSKLRNEPACGRMVGGIRTRQCASVPVEPVMNCSL